MTKILLIKPTERTASLIAKYANSISDLITPTNSELDYMLISFDEVFMEEFNIEDLDLKDPYMLDHELILQAYKDLTTECLFDPNDYLPKSPPVINRKKCKPYKSPQLKQIPHRDKRY